MIQPLADALFMPWVVLVLLGAGLWLTIRTGVVQVRRFGEAWRTAFSRRTTTGSGALTPFQAFMTALAASIGTGNIAGVATAIVSGGPGALFWIWVYGFVAMAIKFAEASLGLTFREIRGGTVKGYLLTIARHLFLAEGRRRGRQVALDAATPDPQPGPEVVVSGRLELAAVLEALQSLPETDRAALLMHAQDDLPYAEIARALGLSLTAVKVRVHRARLKLRQSCDPKGA